VNSHWFRVIGYVVLVLLCLVARRRERSRASEVDGVWPPFWLLTAGFLGAMAIGRAGDIGSLLSDLGRGRAADSGWYETRRPLQAVVVLALGAAWFISVSVACWRTPERRRRYLPMGLMVVTLAAYAAIRVVSLHQVDTLLHRREIAGVRVGAVIEITLLIITGLVTLWVPAGRAASTDDSPSQRPLGARS
jgi:hypothetical protein